MNVGTLEIQLLVNMARLLSDMDRAKRTVGDTVAKMNQVLGTIGVGISVAGFKGMIKSVIDAGDRMNYLRKITGLTVEELGGIGKAAKLNGTDLESVAKAIGIMSKNIAAGSDAFKNLGIETKKSNGDFRSAREVLLDVADRFSQMRDGVQKAAIAQQFFGKTGREMIPFLNEGRGSIEDLIKAYEKTGSMTTKLAEDSDRFNNLLVILNGNVTGTKNNFVTGLLPALNDIAAAFTKVSGSATLFNAIGTGLGIALKAIVIGVVTTGGALKSLGIAIDGIGRQLLALSNLDFKGALAAGDAYFDNIGKTAKANAEFIKTIIEGDNVNDAATKTQIEYNEALEKQRLLMEAGEKVTEKYLDPVVRLRNEQDKLRELVDAGAISQGTYNNALRAAQKAYEASTDSAKNSKKAVDELNKAQQKSLAIEEEYLKLLAIEKKQRQDLIAPYKQSANQADDRLIDMQDEAAALRMVRDKEIDLQEAVQMVTIAKLEERKASVADPEIIRQIEAEIKARREIIPLQKEIAQSTKKTTDEVSQLWMQAGRNIQSTLANSIFNFFDDGLKGMLKNVISTVGRIASEFAALRLAQSIGLSSMFSGGGIGGTGSAGGGVTNALSVASLTSGAGNLMKNGFGLNSVIGGGLSVLPGRIGAFGAGLSGGAVAGVSSPAVMAGASLAPMVAPAMALFAADALARAFAGNKTFGNKFSDTLQKIPVLGIGANIAAALFGHGPMKFRQQVAIGDASSQGFDGRVTDVFRAKGGLLVGNKHKEKDAENASELLDLFSTTIKGYADASRGFAENLGLDVNVINNYSKTIRLESEKGKTLTEEAIRDMLSGIGNEMAQGLLPLVDTFRKTGEDSMATLSRLNAEFVSLQQGAINLGASADYAKQLVKGLGIATRTAYVEAAGGTEELLALTARYNENFLTEAEQMAPKIKIVEDGLRGLGIAADISKDAFGDLIQAMVLAGDANAILLLRFQNEFLEVDKYKQSLKPVTEVQTLDASAIQQQRLGLETQLLQLQGNAVELRRRELETIDPANRALQQRIFDLQDEQALMEKIGQQAKQAIGDAFSGLQRSVEAQRKKVTNAYNQDLLIVNNSIQNVTDSISKLKSLSSALGGTIDALRPLSRDEAKFELLSAINKAKSGGGLPDAANITKVLDVLKSNNITGVRSSFEMAREQAKTANLVADLSSLTDSQLSVEERSLLQLQDQKRTLDEGFKNEMERLDGLLEQAQAQIDAMNGLNTSVVSLTEAIKNFNLASTQGGGGTIGGGDIASGNPNISNQAIIDFFKTEHSARQIYLSAVGNGVSSAQIVNSGAVTQAQADKFFRDNPNIPRFANGGYHRGGLRIVGEDGPELERTGPSNITSNSDMKKATGIDEVIIELREVKKILAAVTQGGTAIRTKTA